nr:hypothetical protein [Candidatus Sigynarchaeota archaeon]
MPAEDTIFYFDLASRGIVSKKAIVKNVLNFIKAKQKETTGSNYGVVAFQHGEDNPAFHEALAKDEDELNPFLKDNLKFSTKAHPIEQGLMLASTYLIEAYRTTRNHVLRMIVISDGPTEESNLDLLNALMDLLDTIKYFPVFIDIIRVGDQRVYPDDVKLKLITDATQGVLCYANSDDAFKDIMEQLATQKKVSRLSGTSIEDKRGYFEGLCWNLIDPGIPDATCTICKKGKDAGNGIFLQCENCGSPYHIICAGEIGHTEYEALPGIFRCKHCNCLLLSRSRKVVGTSAPKPATTAKPAPVVVIPFGGDSGKTAMQSPDLIKIEGMPAEKPVQQKPTFEKLAESFIPFSVKAIGPEKQQQAKPVQKPSSLPVKTIVPSPPPATGNAPGCDDDIMVLGADECDTKVEKKEDQATQDDDIVIMDDEHKPDSFWKKGKK